jgi:hypothetical protein
MYAPCGPAGRLGWRPAWLSERYYQAFEVETICRALFLLEFGRQPTKPEAVGWALREPEEPWRSLVEWARVHHADKTWDLAKMPDVASFVRWAVGRAGVG